MRAALSTLTTRGRAFLSAGITAAVCAIVLGQKDLLRVGLLLIALPVLTALVAHRSRYLLVLLARGHPDSRRGRADARPCRSTCENPGRVPTGLMLLEDQVPYVLGSRPRFVLDQLRPRWHRSMAYTGPIGGPRALQHRAADGPAERPVRLRRAHPLVHRTRVALVVTPVVVPSCPPVQLSGDWSGTGDNRPRAFAAAGTEDVTVREYRLGRRPAPDPLALDRPRRRADGAARGAAAPEPSHHPARHARQSRTAAPGRRRRSSTRSRPPRRSVRTWPVRASPCGCSPTRPRRRRDLARPRHQRLGVEVQLLLDSLAVISTSVPQPHRRRVRRAQRLRPRRRRARCDLPHRRRRPVDAAGRREPGARHRRSTSPPGPASGRPADISAPTADEQAKALRQNGWAVVVARPG